ncbi:carboxylating nicotinate-nucleotide diphosphorylase [endosymbiont of unidentified scaly snail isolate Monju]|uniref:carboxylating nicotinate-nucleotide diphosphorylase n=1 Tax=endosymbiont of unidentified scaly snail isolate Monju TaxID=1248727 RepID=UPI0003892BAF|nr:carboxylating nicotinate-nucleotide diphosphorylase [endosymbiont of unidentified scaly snail isolate Monju]BAN68542.1 nicotinate-nucleotide pyrophosphorylase [endosymbiont of unidentified scaly snail isolate Monju]
MKPDAAEIARQVRQALREDLGEGDLTAQLVPATVQAQATVIAREPAVLCGRDWLDEVLRQVDPACRAEWAVADGEALTPDRPLCRLQGPARSLLTAERTALNFLQTLSGTATLAARYVQAVAGTGARILDTRKTVPGLRLAQKYAVRCGGASNHRIGLFDAILIKENHIAAAGSIAGALAAAQRICEDLGRPVEIEIEVEDLAQLEEALAQGAKRVLLDNFDLPALREAVRLNAGRARLEASGGVDLETVRAIAETGVDDISVGALTKDVHAVDLSMRFT